MTGHVHDPYRCPAHTGGCGCPNPENSLCNPYHVGGYCPDDLQVMPGGEDEPEAA